jgi:poly-gamma-glutamate synthesis protein (capsule biosynthesis protein)
MNISYNKLFSKKVILFSILLLITCMLIVSCNRKKIEEPIVVDNDRNADLNTDITSAPDESKETVSTQVVSLINTDGTTLEERINTPKGFSRLASSQDELTGFIRGLQLKKAGSQVLLYDGKEKDYQDGHIAIFDIDVGERDLQQCADSVIRIYAEYYWSIGAYDRIAFHLTNGFLMEYTKWRDGNRLVVDGNDTSWSKKAQYDDSYENFRKYLNIIYSYAGTMSLSEECDRISMEEILPGDMFIYGGSPGHCVLVVDVAADASGNKCFLLAQGYMPAQDFHILKNPLHPEDPWYYTTEIKYPLETPQWSFEEGSLVRWDYLYPNDASTSLTILKNNRANSFNGSDTIYASSDNVVKGSGSFSVKLLAVGDNLIHTQVINSGKQSDGTYNYDHLYSNVKDIISAADIAIINQETILGGTAFPYSGYPRFNSPDEIGTAVVNAGFDVILQATNHTLDMGLDGVLNDMAFWNRQHPDITVLGINESKEEYEQIPIIEKNGIKLAMLNYTYSLNGQPLPEDMPYLVNMLDRKKMARDIEKAEELADFTIVFPHWGPEYVYEASKSQKDLAAFFYDHGVDLVIGSHPHVLEQVEWLKTDEDHQMLIYYSLGNFMSYQKEAPRMLGGIAEVTITKDETGTYISDAGITPILTHYENGPADYNYAIYQLDEYNDVLADSHGVTELATQGPLTYDGTLNLAKQILGSWYK